MKDEQNIDFSSLNSQAIQTEIEKIKSNTLIHNVIISNDLRVPIFEINRNNSSLISYLANKIFSYSGLKVVLNIFQGAASSVSQKAIETTLDVTLNTVVNSVDEKKISDVSNKIKNEFNLNEEQNKKLSQLQEKFKKDRPDSEEVMSFAYDVLSSNNYSDQDIIDLAKNYLPDSMNLSDEMLLRLIDRYKDDSSFDVSLSSSLSMNKLGSIKNDESLNSSKNTNFQDIQLNEEKNELNEENTQVLAETIKINQKLWDILKGLIVMNLIKN
ncbi:MAG: hypothetical protein ACJZ41_06255 [Candidatus Pelagibacterales bacterium]